MTAIMDEHSLYWSASEESRTSRGSSFAHLDRTRAPSNTAKRSDIGVAMRCYSWRRVLAPPSLRSHSRFGFPFPLSVRARSPLVGAAAIFMVVAAWAGPARADRALARSLVEEGERLSGAGHSATALVRLEQAIDEDPDYLPAYEAA